VVISLSKFTQYGNFKKALMTHNIITMFYNYYEDYQYDSCVSKGICSIGPRTSSLREVLIMYLKLLAFYSIELKSFGGHNKDAQKVILDTISALMSNMESDDKQFEKALIDIKTLLVDSKKTYLKLCKEKNIEPKFIQTSIKLDEKLDITKLIQQGEHEYSRRTQHLSPERKNLLEIMSYIIKSLCVNVVELESYSSSENLYEEGINKILILLNFLNYSDTDEKDILDEINSSAKVDYEIYKKIFELKEQRYGKPIETKISLSTRPGKAILVAGTNLRELEKVLEYTKDKNVDVYTHGELYVAHTYPKFKEYSNLVGHFGVGVENCLLDFATFPGAILITKHAVDNIEYLYRGRLFTTDYFVPKGAVRIINNDFSKLVESAKAAKGFKRGKQKEPICAGHIANAVRIKLEEFISNITNYKHLFIIGPEGHTNNNRLYFTNFLKNVPKDVFIISFSCNDENDNIAYLNGLSDFSLVYLILDWLKPSLVENNINISVFISKCDKHTISNIINLNTLGIKHLYLSKCTPIMLNPALIKILTKYYNVKSTEYPIDDLKHIIEE